MGTVGAHSLEHAPECKPTKQKEILVYRVAKLGKPCKANALN